MLVVCTKQEVWGSSNLMTPTNSCCHGNQPFVLNQRKNWLGYSSASVRDVFEIFASNKGYMGMLD